MTSKWNVIHMVVLACIGLSACFELGSYCRTACLHGRGGNLCKCSSAHFAGKRGRAFPSLEERLGGGGRGSLLTNTDSNANEGEEGEELPTETEFEREELSRTKDLLPLDAEQERQNSDAIEMAMAGHLNPSYKHSTGRRQGTRRDLAR